MLDFVKLGIDIESRSAKEAAEDLRKLTRAGADTERQFNRTERATDAVADEMNDLTRATDRAGRETDQLARSTRRATGQMTMMQGAAASVTRRIVAMAGAFAAFAAGTAGFGAAVRTIVGFDRQMAAVRAITGATDDEFKALRDSAKELGATTEFTAAQAASGLRFLGMAGFEAAEAVEAIPAVLNLATAAQMDLGRAADISSNIMSAFGIEAKNASSVADVLAAASSKANTDVEQLGTAMALVGPVAAAMGISVNDTAAAIGKLSDAGIQGSLAGTGLRRILSALANATPQATDAIEKMGLKLSDLDPTTNSLVDIVQRFAGANLSAADALTIFGDRGGPAILALAGMSEELAELTTEMNQVDGAAERMATIFRDQLGGDIDGLVSAIQGLFIALGDAGLTSALRGAVQSMTAFVRALTGIIDGTQEATGFVGAFANAMKFLWDVTLGMVGTVAMIAEETVALAAAFGDATGITDLLVAAFGSLESAGTAIGVVLGIALVGRLAAAGLAMVGFATSTGLATAAVTAFNGVTALIGGGLVAITSRAGLAAAGIGLITGAVRALSLAVRFFGGPWGLLISGLISAVVWWRANKRGIEGLEQPLYDAAEAQEELNEAMRIYRETEAPDAAKSALDTALAYNQQAQAAYDVAEAELEKRRALLESYRETRRQAEETTSFGMGGLSSMAAGAAREEELAYKAVLEAVERVKSAKIDSEQAGRRLTNIVNELMANFDDAADKASDLADETGDAGDEADRVLRIVGQLPGSLDGASGAALLLASQLGASADHAERLLAALDAAAGIDSAPAAPPALGFGLPSMDTGGMGQFDIGFGDTSAEASAQRKLEAYWKRREELENARTRTSRGGGGGGGKTAAQELEDISTAYDSLMRSLDPVYARTRELEEAQKVLNDAFAAGVIEEKELTRATDLLEDKYAELSNTTQQLKSDFASTFSEIIRGAKSAKDAIADLASRWADLFLQKGFEQLFNWSGAGGLFDGFFKALGWNAQGTTFWRGGPTVVGEEGMEIAQLPDGDALKVGVGGPQIIDLPAGTEIFPHEQSRLMEKATDIMAIKRDAPPLAQTVGAGSMGNAGGTTAPRSLGMISHSIEPLRAEPRFSRFAERGLERKPQEMQMAKQEPPEIKVEPVIEVYNFFDRDKMVGAYLDSPQGRIKVANNVAEEQALR